MKIPLREFYGTVNVVSYIYVGQDEIQRGSR